MNQLINLKTPLRAVRNSVPATAKRGFLFVVLALAWFALSSASNAFGVTPAPDGGYPNNNTAEGTNALKSLSSFGTDNTAIGFEALFSNTFGRYNTTIGSQALGSNTTASFNTAAGASALQNNTTGTDNTAGGSFALQNNTTGTDNTATGSFALAFNATGGGNTATGSFALNNTIGNNNTATGVNALCGCFSEITLTATNNTATGANALSSNNTGNHNTATGVNALQFNQTGSFNTAEGVGALANNSTGERNIAVGFNAGSNLTTGSNNIDIGAQGRVGESNTIRIGTVGVQTSAYIRGISGSTVASGVTVIVGSNGHLGTVVPSQRFKEVIKPMDKASEAILALKPVTFRYKKELDREGVPQFGLVAEEVEKVNPDLVARDENGQVYSVRYEAVNAMLLNEFLKEHGKVQELEKVLRAAIAQQQKQIEALTTSLQKVSDQLELSKPAPQMVADNQ